MNIFGLHGWYHKPIEVVVGGGGGGPQSFSIELDTTSQPFVSTIEWPSHFSVPVESGQIFSNYPLRLTQQYSGGDETYKIAQFEPVAYWPGGSVKWLHVHSDLAWSGGTAPDYKLKWGAGLAAQPSSPLVATSTASGITIDTGLRTFTILNTGPIINSGLYYVVDGNGTRYLPTNVSTTIEHSGRHEVVVLVTGTLGPFTKFISRITANANSDIVKYQHAAVFTADMKTNHMAELSFKFSGVQQQVLTRDFDKKLPYAVSYSGGHTYVSLWPSGRADTNVVDDYARADAYKFKYLHKGSGSNSVLNATVPPGYSGYLRDVPDSDISQEEIEGPYWSGTINLDLIGVTMGAEFAINLGTSGDYQTIFTHHPIGYRAIATAGPTNVMGYHGQYEAPYDDIINDAIVGYWFTNERYQEYGWHMWGQTHDSEFPMLYPNYYRVAGNDHYNTTRLAWQQFFTTANTGVLDAARRSTNFIANIAGINHDSPNFAVDSRQKGKSVHVNAYNAFGVALDFPSWQYASHRHFSFGSRFLLSWLINADRWAKEQYHNFLDLKEYNYIYNGGDGSWRNTYTSGVAGNLYRSDRETTLPFVEDLIAYEYDPNRTGLEESIHLFASGAIQALPTGLIQNYITNNLAAPEWLTKYADMFPNRQSNPNTSRTFEDIIVDSAINLSGYHNNGGWAIAAKAYEITDNPGHLRQYGSLLNTWRHVVYYGSEPMMRYFAPSLDTNTVFRYSAWARFKYAMQELDETLPVYPEAGTYLNSNITDVSYTLNTNTGVIDSYGTKIYIYNAGAATPFPDTAVTPIGRESHTKMYLRTASGIRVSDMVDRFLDMNDEQVIASGRLYRDSSSIYYLRDTSASGVTIPTGISQFVIGGFNTYYRPALGLPEAQLIEAHNGTGGDERLNYAANNYSGVLYPLTTPITGYFRCRHFSSNFRKGHGFISFNGSGYYSYDGEAMQSIVLTGPTTIVVDSEQSVMQIRFSGNPLPYNKLALCGSLADITTLLPMVTDLDY